MAKRFTDTDKWKKIWFRKLNPIHKTFWQYLCDNCNHAGIWEVDFELAEILIGSKINQTEIEDVFRKQFECLNSGKKWFIRDFVDFQYGDLNPSNRLHLSVINILKKEGAYKGLIRGLEAPKELDKELDKDKDKDKDRDFISSLKNNLAYKHINIDIELAKMDTWLLVHKGRQKTPRFVVSWLNKIDKPLEAQRPEIKQEKIIPINLEEHAKVSKLIHETTIKMKND